MFFKKKKVEEPTPITPWSKEIAQEVARKYVGKTFQNKTNYTIITITGVCLYQNEITLLGAIPGTVWCTLSHIDESFEEITL